MTAVQEATGNYRAALDAKETAAETYHGHLKAWRVLFCPWTIVNKAQDFADACMVESKAFGDMLHAMRAQDQERGR